VDSVAASLWVAASVHEASGEHAAAARARLRILQRAPDQVRNYWQLARDFLRAGEELPAEDRQGRRRAFQEALRWARRGAVLDASCPECCSYEFAAAAELLTLADPGEALGRIGGVGRTLERCLAGAPDPASSGPERGDLAEAAALYAGAATFYRRLPDSPWLHLASGVRGDPARAVRLARRALVLAPGRADYQLELAAGLLCLAHSRGDAAARKQGIQVLQGALGLGPPVAPKARALLSAPERACHFGPELRALR